MAHGVYMYIIMKALNGFLMTLIVSLCFIICQIMEHTGRCVAVSDPNSLYFLAAKYPKSGDSVELCHLARDIIRWDCRPYPTMQPPPLGYFLKLTSTCCVLLPMLRQCRRSVCYYLSFNFICLWLSVCLAGGDPCGVPTECSRNVHTVSCRVTGGYDGRQLNRKILHQNANILCIL